jgi:anti-sigma regulatory factor (Ser/Thr protein kinase)
MKELALAAREPEFADLSLIRTLIRDLTRGSGHAERQEDLALVVTELVTNALRHGRRPVQLSVSERTGQLLVEVSDAGQEDPSFPVPRPRTPTDAESERGLLLVDSLADACGVRREGAGKRVWAAFRLPPDPESRETAGGDAERAD